MLRKKPNRTFPGPFRLRYTGIRFGCVTGYVYTEADPNLRFNVELLGLNAKAYASSRADLSRDTVPTACGFSIPVPLNWLTDGNNQILLRVSETGRCFPEAPKYFFGSPIGPPTSGLRQLSDILKQAAGRIEKKLGAKRGRKSIVLVTHSSKPTGAPMIALDILRHLTGDGTCDVIMFSLESGELAPKFADLAVEYLENPPYFTEQPEIFALALRATVLPILRKSGVQGAIVNSLCSFSLQSVLKDCGFRTLSFFHEFPFHWEPHPDIIRRALESANHVVLPCQLVSDAFQPYLNEGLEETKFTIQPQGFYKKHSITGSRDFTRTCEERLILGAGSVTARKGTDWFVGFAKWFLSWRAALGDPVPYRFVWMGEKDNDELWDHLQIEIAASQWSRQVELVGHVDVLDWMRRGDAFLLTSRIDPFPSVVLEAASMGLPIVAFDRRQGTSELILKHQLGCVVPYLEVEPTARALLEVLARSPQEKERLATNAILHIEENFNRDDYGMVVRQLVDRHLMLDP